MDDNKENIHLGDEKVKSKILKSVKWTAGNSVLNMLYGPIYKIVMALVVDPVGFAYISAFAAVNSIGSLLNKIGLGQALLVEKETDTRQFSSVFWVDVIKALLICVGIILLSPFIEMYYGLEGLGYMVAFFGISIFLSGASRVFRCYLQKELYLDSLVKIEVVQLLLDGILSITSICLLKSIFGYVIGTLVSHIISSALLVFASFRRGFRVKMCFDFSLVKKMGSYAQAVSARQILNYIVGIADELVIARLFSDKSILGYYYFAKDLIKKPQEVITAAVSRIALSAMAKFSDELKKLATLFSVMSKYLALVALPVFGGIILTADMFVPMFFGKEYTAAIFPISMFCISAAVSTISFSPASAVLYALKKPGTVLKIDMAINIGYIVALLLVPKNSVNAILFVAISEIILKALFYNVFARKNSKITLLSFLKLLKATIISVAAMMITGCFVKLVLSAFFENIVALSGVIIWGVVVHVGMMLILDKSFVKKALKTLKNQGSEV